MSTLKIVLSKLNGNAKAELMSQEMTAGQIAFQLEKGLKDLKKLISFYTIDKKADYRLEIGDKSFNFVGNKFAGSLTQVLNMVAASEMQKVGRGAELRNIQVLGGILEESVKIEPELLTRLALADKIIDGNAIAFIELSKNFKVDFDENIVKIDAETKVDDNE